MTEIPMYQIGAVIIYSPDNFYVLHERKKAHDNGEIGKIGLYGGQYDPAKDNDLRDTASRELLEEAGVLFQPHELKYEDFVHALSERDGETVVTETDIFSLGLPGDMDTKQVEEMFRDSTTLTPREVSRAIILGHLTTVATAAFGKVKLI